MRIMMLGTAMNRPIHNVQWAEQFNCPNFVLLVPLIKLETIYNINDNIALPFHSNLRSRTPTYSYSLTPN